MWQSFAVHHHHVHSFSANLGMRFAAALLIAACAFPALAQDTDSAKPAAGLSAADKATQRSIRRQQLEAAKPVDPVMLAIVESNPTTPVELFQAVETLASLEQYELARKYLKQLVDAAPDNDALNYLVLKFGSPAVERIIAHDKLAPESEEFGKKIVAAMEARRSDTARLNSLVNQLIDSDAAKRQAAMLELRRAGSAAVAPLLTAMIEKPQATLSVAARDMLVRLGSDAVDPLIAVLQSGSGDQQRIAANLLAILKPERALAPLVVALASQPAAAENSEALNAAIEQVAGRPLEPAEQIQFLENEALRQHKLAKVLENQDNYGAAPPSVIDWQWNPDSRELTRGIILEPALARSRAKRAIDAVAASVGTSRPLSPATRQLRWLILLNEAKHRLGFDQPLTPADVPLDEISLDELNELLKYALDRQELTAALGVVELMGQIGSPRLLLAADGKPTPLAQAARHGNRRLRFAALKAIVAIKPTEPFAGASAVGEGLAYFAKTLGMRRALVVDPRSEAAQQVASHLSGLGYDTEIATNGRKGFELATGSADFELAILHMAIDRPRIDDLLLQLRKDARTAEMPIGLVAVPGRETTADRLARGYDLVYPMAEALDAAATKHYVERLLQQPGAQSVDAETRLAQAAWATQTIADLIEQRVKWVDARAIARSLEVGILAALPDLREPTITLLGNTPDERSQVELARIVQLETLPAVTREAAALALARNITGHGVQLPRSVLLGLYRRYNENAGRNADTHKMLSIVLDAIETEKAQVADEAGTNIAPIKPPSPAASN